MNSDAFQFLVQDVPPPLEVDSRFKREGLFSRFNLTCAPPADLLELYSVYGTGSFWCETENLDLLEPTEEAPEELLYVAENAVVAELDDNPFDTIFREKPLPLNFILWGHTSSGGLLASMKSDSRLDWVVVVIANNYADSVCHFAPISVFLTKYFSGTLKIDELGEWHGKTKFVQS